MSDLIVFYVIQTFYASTLSVIRFGGGDRGWLKFNYGGVGSANRNLIMRGEEKNWLSGGGSCYKNNLIMGDRAKTSLIKVIHLDPIQGGRGPATKLI